MTTETSSVSDGKRLLLHLSDIHFQEPYCTNTDTDEEHVVRAILLSDLKRMVSKLGNIDAVIISGDIAFKGHADEYKAAAEWLLEVAAIAGCKTRDIYTVPGNHDIDRFAVDSRKVLGLRELVFKKNSLHDRSKELQDILQDEEISQDLFRPMAEYNLFSASYDCDINPDRPFWSDSMSLTRGWDLKIHGLTTVFFSGPKDDEKGDLLLGSLQRAFSPMDGVIRLVVMHHPPDWLYDQEEMDDALWQHCALHLLGHKHRQRYTATNDGIRFIAGAVNPARNEESWEPGYNLIKLGVSSDSGQHFLDVESYQRVWQTAPDRFVGKQDEDDKEVFNHRIRLQQNPCPDVETVGVSYIEPNDDKVDADISTVGTVSVVEKTTIRASGTTMHQKDIIFHFWELTTSDRRKIMQSLDLLEPDDDKLPEPQRYRRAFQKASKQNLMAEIELAILEKLEG